MPYVASVITRRGIGNAIQVIMYVIISPSVWPVSKGSADGQVGSGSRSSGRAGQGRLTFLSSDKIVVFSVRTWLGSSIMYLWRAGRVTAALYNAEEGRGSIGQSAG